jgi:hypothetical protein
LASGGVLSREDVDGDRFSNTLNLAVRISIAMTKVSLNTIDRASRCAIIGELFAERADVGRRWRGQLTELNLDTYIRASFEII